MSSQDCPFIQAKMWPLPASRDGGDEKRLLTDRCCIAFTNVSSAAFKFSSFALMFLNPF